MNFVCTPDEPHLSLDDRRLVPRQLRAFLVIIQRCAHEEEDTEENEDGTVTYFPKEDVVEGLVLVPNPDSLTVFEKLGTLGNDRVEKTLAEHRAAEISSYSIEPCPDLSTKLRKDTCAWYIHADMSPWIFTFTYAMPQLPLSSSLFAASILTRRCCLASTSYPNQRYLRRRSFLL